MFPMLFILGVFVFVILVLVFLYWPADSGLEGVKDRANANANELVNAITSHFNNLSPLGYHYETTTLKFVKPADRVIAVNALYKLCQENGLKYTVDQLGKVPDLNMMNILEVDDDSQIPVQLAQLVLLVDENYDTAKAAVKAAIKNGAFANASERTLVYELLTKYFIALKTPIGVPLARWTDMQLITTFRTFRLPPMRSFTT